MRHFLNENYTHCMKYSFSPLKHSLPFKYKCGARKSVMSAPELGERLERFVLFDICGCCRAYDRTMRHKLGLLELEQESDEGLVRDLLQVSTVHCIRVLINNIRCFAWPSLICGRMAAPAFAGMWWPECTPGLEQASDCSVSCHDSQSTARCVDNVCNRRRLHQHLPLAG